MKDSLLTINEVADALRLRPKTVRKWLYLGRLQAVKIGRSVRVRQSSVDALIRKGTQGFQKEKSAAHSMASKLTATVEDLTGRPQGAR